MNNQPPQFQPRNNLNPQSFEQIQPRTNSQTNQPPQIQPRNNLAPSQSQTESFNNVNQVNQNQGGNNQFNPTVVNQANGYATANMNNQVNLNNLQPVQFQSNLGANLNNAVAPIDHSVKKISHKEVNQLLPRALAREIIYEKLVAFLMIFVGGVATAVAIALIVLYY